MRLVGLRLVGPWGYGSAAGGRQARLQPRKGPPQGAGRAAPRHCTLRCMVGPKLARTDPIQEAAARGGVGARVTQWRRSVCSVGGRKAVALYEWGAKLHGLQKVFERRCGPTGSPARRAASGRETGCGVWRGGGRDGGLMAAGSAGRPWAHTAGGRLGVLTGSMRACANAGRWRLRPIDGGAAAASRRRACLGAEGPCLGGAVCCGPTGPRSTHTGSQGAAGRGQISG
jgi:hypothetical protein